MSEISKEILKKFENLKKEADSLNKKIETSKKLGEEISETIQQNIKLIFDTLNKALIETNNEITNRTKDNKVAQDIAKILTTLLQDKINSFGLVIQNSSKDITTKLQDIVELSKEINNKIQTTVKTNEDLINELKKIIS